MVRDWLVLISLGTVLSLVVSWQPCRRLLVWALPIAGIVLLVLHRDATPVERLTAASLGMIFEMKSAILCTYSFEDVRRMRPGLFLLWPGMDPTRLARSTVTDEDAAPIPQGLVSIYLGLTVLLVALFAPVGQTAAGWLGILGLLLVIHFGLSDLLSGTFRLSGVGVKRLFDRPLASKTLNEFWTRRWNMPFVEMDRRLFVPGFVRLFGAHGAIFGVFLVSGLLHEMAISYPAGGGWGLPIAYFAIQGALVLLERKLRIRSRAFTWAAILIPLPLVFTGQFRQAFVSPMLEAMRHGLATHNLDWYFDRGLWVMGIAHFLVLIASFQVPSKLNWREELPRLSSFNRKLMYAYGAFIMLTIVVFGSFTIFMHHDLLVGSASALFFAGFISLFWALRLCLDAFYYRHEDWPKGTQFVVGHALLTSLFTFLCLSYASLLVWHVLV